MRTSKNNFPARKEMDYLYKNTESACKEDDDIYKNTFSARKREQYLYKNTNMEGAHNKTKVGDQRTHGEAAPLNKPISAGEEKTSGIKMNPSAAT